MKPVGSYSWLPTDIVRSSTLSFDAKGILLWMMSHAPGYDFDRDDIIAAGPDGKHVVVQALAELREQGFIESVQSRQGWTLRVILDSTVESVEGQTDVEDSGPLSGRLSGPQSTPQPPDILPGIRAKVSALNSDKALPENQAVLYVEKKTTKEKEPPISPAVVGASFERAWKAWPRSDGKHMAQIKYESLIRAKVIQTDILETAVIEFGMAYAATTERQFTPHLATWLNQRRWTDELPRLGPRRLTNAERNAEVVRELQRAEQLGIEA